jgi:hypothetical protein
MSMYVDDQECVNIIEEAGKELKSILLDLEEDEDLETTFVHVKASVIVGALELLLAMCMTYEKYAPASCPQFDFEDMHVTSAVHH